MNGDLLQTNALSWGEPTLPIWASDKTIVPTDAKPSATAERALTLEPSQPRYVKEIYTTVLLDSRDRNIDRYPYPNNFTLPLGRQFENLKQITIESVDIDNTTPPVGQYNNTIQWAYPRECDVSPDGILVPTLKNSDLPAEFFAQERIIYTAKLFIGFYTLYELRKMLMNQMNLIPHSGADTGMYNLAGQAHSWHMDVSVVTHNIPFVDRIINYNPVVIQTILNSQDDIWLPYITGVQTSPDPNAVFITIPDNGIFAWKGDSPVVGDLSKCSLYPVVFTHLSTVGGIPNQLFNDVPFWDGNISDGIKDYPYYLACTGENIQVGNKKFSRYKFYPKTGAVLATTGVSLSGEPYQRVTGGTGLPISASYSENVMLSDSLALYLNALTTEAADFQSPYNVPNQSNVLNNDSDINNYLIPQGGLALPFQFITVPQAAPTDCNLNANCAPRQISVLILFGWDPASIGYGYIHTNISVADGQTPHKLVEWERNAVGDYIMTSERYLLMRIIVPSRDQDQSGGNIVKTTSSNRTDNTNNVGFFIEPRRNLNERNLNSLFAKIRMNSTQPNRSSSFSSSSLKFYDKPLDKLTEFTVQITDHNGQLVNIRNDWNFSVEIVELQEVLTETLIDSRHGKHVVTGSY